MSARHTPGPWAVFERGIRAGSICTIVHRVKWWACGLDESEEIANARLIAAAPELLSELKAHQQALSMLLDALEIDAKGTCFNFKAGDGSLIAKITFSELQSRSVAAIAKATGATP